MCDSTNDKICGKKRSVTMVDLPHHDDHDVVVSEYNRISEAEQHFFHNEKGFSKDRNSLLHFLNIYKAMKTKSDRRDFIKSMNKMTSKSLKKVLDMIFTVEWPEEHPIKRKKTDVIDELEYLTLRYTAKDVHSIFHTTKRLTKRLTKRAANRKIRGRITDPFINLDSNLITPHLNDRQREDRLTFKFNEYDSDSNSDDPYVSNSDFYDCDSESSDES